MAKPFAKSFYKSRAWRDSRNAFFANREGLCEPCGKAGDEVHHIKPLTIANIGDPEITLSWDNLQLLCKDCHFAIHDKAKYKYKPDNSPQRITYDEHGNPIPTGQIVIIWGSPASGKTTYAMEHMQQGDIIVDVDNIIKCFTGLSNKTDNNARIRPYLPFALSVRDYIYRLIIDNKHGIGTAWIVAGLPERKERLALAASIKARLVHIGTSREDCIAHALADPNRTDKTFQRKIIDWYFERLEI